MNDIYLGITYIFGEKIYYEHFQKQEDGFLKRVGVISWWGPNNTILGLYQFDKIFAVRIKYVGFNGNSFIKNIVGENAAEVCLLLSITENINSDRIVDIKQVSLNSTKDSHWL